jgi:DNA-binding beta-propeller fold protein YncE
MGEDIKASGTPEAIAVDAEGNVYISDYVFGRIQVFDNAGKFLWALSSDSISNSMFKRPTGLALDANGRLLVVNQSGNKVSVFQLP